MDGVCRVLLDGGERVVKVNKEGVGAREDFLRKCLVLRMVGDEMSCADWSLFGTWAKQWWGVQVEERRSLSDDLWLLKLPGKADVDRIMNLGRWSFRGRKIEADIWLPCAGRSSVVADKGIVWLRLDGIPLHLRSTDLFRKLGNVCGRFLEFNEEGCSLNAIRLKVSRAGVIPCRISVVLEETRFLIHVVVESGRCFTEGWRGRGSEVFIRTRSMAAGSPEVNNARREVSVEENPKGACESSGRVGETGGDNVALQSRDADTAGDGGETVKVDRDVLMEAESLEELKKFGDSGMGGVELRKESVLFEIEGAGVEGTRGKDFCSRQDFVGNMEKGGVVDEGMHVEGDNNVGLIRIGPSPIEEEVGLFTFKKTRNEDTQRRMGLDGIVDPLTKSIDEIEDGKGRDGLVLPLSLEEECFFQTLSQVPETESDVEMEDSEVGYDSKEEEFGVSKGLVLSESDQEEEEDELSCDSNDGVIEESLRLAERLQLQVKGSQSAAKEVVQKVADEVLSKRNKAVATSKKERELRRIQIDGTFSDTSKRRASRVRGDASVSISYHES
ncbi:hypothetical protein LINGRAHAP2_LOCUS26821 [Linum grandiflorum]